MEPPALLTCGLRPAGCCLFGGEGWACAHSSWLLGSGPTSCLRDRNQWQSVAISGHQRSSTVINGHQRPDIKSVVISGHQRSSAVIMPEMLDAIGVFSGVLPRRRQEPVVVSVCWVRAVGKAARPLERWRCTCMARARMARRAPLVVWGRYAIERDQVRVATRPSGATWPFGATRPSGAARPSGATWPFGALLASFHVSRMGPSHDVLVLL